MTFCNKTRTPFHSKNKQVFAINLWIDRSRTRVQMNDDHGFVDSTLITLRAMESIEVMKIKLPYKCTYESMRWNFFLNLMKNNHLFMSLWCNSAILRRIHKLN